MGFVEWFKAFLAPFEEPPVPLPHMPHPENVPGQFYVVNSCCMSCGVPEAEASDLFGWAKEDDLHCIIKKQPSTPEEFDRMRAAMCAQELDCIRARFCDPEFLEVLKETGDDRQVDRLPDPISSS